VSAYKEVSLDSILPQVSRGLQDLAKDKDGPQSSGMSAGSIVSSKLQDHASDGGAPQSSVGSVSSQVSGGLQNTSNQTMQRSNQESNQCPNRMPAFPLELMSIIKEIRGQPIPAPTEPEFFFEMTQEAAAKNFFLFKQYNFNLGRAVEAQKLSPLSYGSEFKKP
jgi:hypothetical protein